MALAATDLTWEQAGSVHPRYAFVSRRAAILRGDDGIQTRILAKIPQIWWEIGPSHPFQPMPRRTAYKYSAAVMLGDSGIQFIYYPPLVLAMPRTSFPITPANVASALPSYNAGPQVGSINSTANIGTPVVLKATAGTLFAVTVIVGGSTAGAVHDCASIGAANQGNEICPIPTSGGPLFLLEWPFQNGIVIVPGTDQVLAAKWARATRGRVLTFSCRMQRARSRWRTYSS